jgi:hypothetical protein
MMQLPVAISYFAWHYSKGLRDLFVAWGNITWATINFFSVPLLLGTFFAPWKRMEDTAPEGDIEGFFETVVVNTLSRIVGMFIRFWLIVLGVLSGLLSLVMLAFLVVIWLVSPFASIVAVVYGVLIISGAV